VTDDIKKLTVHCAACGKLLGSVSNDGWVWNAGAPARLVNRRRLVATGSWPSDTDAVEHAASPENFRMRTVEHRSLERDFRVWEYPYVCNADACTDALGTEWDSRPAGPPFSVMPEGRVLS